MGEHALYQVLHVVECFRRAGVRCLLRTVRHALANELSEACYSETTCIAPAAGKS